MRGPPVSGFFMEARMTISESHRQMLRTMLQFEIDNYINPRIKEIQERKMARNEEVYLLTAREYLEKRVKALAE